ncbi:MAG TPA: hypothetical protein VHE55_12475 [Fimbriimonadaceae bacterium]|nr:hypothetical protein [Fimbriimonadaceae bacterium]
MRKLQILALTLCAVALLGGCGGSTYSAGVSGSGPYTDSLAKSINDSGFAVGYSAGATVTAHAVLFVPSGQTAPASYSVTDLGTLGGTTANATAISPSGKVTGWSSDGISSTHAFLYTNGSMTDLGVIQGDNVSVGLSVNDSGMVVGQSGNTFASTGQAIIYTPGSGLHHIDPPAQTSAAVATGINASGAIVGVYLDSQNRYAAFACDQSLVTVDMGSPAIKAYPHAINDNAYVVGDTSPTGGWWYQETIGYTALPNHGGSSGTQLTGINDHNVMVGSDLIDGHSHAVSYTLAGVETDLGVLGGNPRIVDLNARISSADQQTYGTITEATGISASGQICCNTQNGRAVLLTPSP